MGMRGSITLAVCAAAAAALAGTAGAADKGESTFAAIALEAKSGAVSSVWLHDSLAEAEEAALLGCKDIADKPSKCRVKITAENGCIAAVNSGKAGEFRYGFGSGATAKKAEKAARKDLSRGVPHVLRSICSATGPA